MYKMDEEGMDQSKTKEVAYLNFIKPGNTMKFVLIVEALKCLYLFIFENYHDLDYSSYHGQAQMYLDGEKDYSNLYGVRGPSQYPALHLYTYTIFNLITSDFRNPYPVIIATTFVHLTI